MSSLVSSRHSVAKLIKVGCDKILGGGSQRSAGRAVLDSGRFDPDGLEGKLARHVTEDAGIGEESKFGR